MGVDFHDTIYPVKRTARDSPTLWATGITNKQVCGTERAEVAGFCGRWLIWCETLQIGRVVGDTVQRFADDWDDVKGHFPGDMSTLVAVTKSAGDWQRIGTKGDAQCAVATMAIDFDVGYGYGHGDVVHNRKVVISPQVRHDETDYRDYIFTEYLASGIIPCPCCSPFEQPFC